MGGKEVSENAGSWALAQPCCWDSPRTEPRKPQLQKSLWDPHEQPGSGSRGLVTLVRKTVRNIPAPRIFPPASGA